MAGLELARECMRLDRDLSVLYVSASELNEDHRIDIVGRKPGFLLKPFNGNDLRRKVKELLLTETTLQPSSAAKPESFSRQVRVRPQTLHPFLFEVRAWASPVSFDEGWYTRTATRLGATVKEDGPT